MSRPPVIAIAGATGLVGNEMLAVIEQLKLPFAEVKLLASSDSVGEVYRIGTREVAVELLTPQAFKGVDVALFATSAELSQKFVPAAAEAGAICIDNSSFFRMDPTIPLIVPEVNFDLLQPNHRIIANPNCSTIQLVPVLQVLEKAAGLRRVVVSTYQAVSGAGKDALDELWAQLLAVFNQKEVPIEALPHQLAFNLIPRIDLMLDNGYSKEEMKIVNESRKILGLPQLRITATAVRVPVMHSHSESVNVELERELSLSDFTRLLERAPGISVYPEYDSYPMPLDVAGSDEIHVGRVRRDESVPHGFNMWIVADNVRKGAALNAVQIAQRWLAKFGLSG